MSQQGSNTTFRVGGTARQAGGNWTGRFENPEGLNAWHSMYGSRLEPGDTVTVGDAILKWNGSAYKVIDGDFVDGPTAKAWAAKFSPELASSSTATIAGVPSVYRGQGVGWVAQSSSSPPQYASYAALPATAENGSIANIPKLRGPGLVRLRYIQESARWEVEEGQVIASAINPFSVTAGAVGNYDQTFCTIPVGMWGENEEWEFAQPTESVSGNIGIVTSRIFIGAFESEWPMAASRRDAATVRFVRRNNNPRRSWLTVGQDVDYGLGYITPDMSQPLEFRHRLTIASAGDSVNIIHSHIRRIA